MLPTLGGLELIILLAIILLLFGAKRIPQLARSLGRGTYEFRKGISEVSKGEAQEEDRKEKYEEKEPYLDGEAHGTSRSEAEKSTRTERKP